MPNIITHGLFAKAVYDEIQDDNLKQIIKEFPREFVIGSNGPDFLFFYKLFQKKALPIRELGSLVHSEKTNAFYNQAFDLISQEKNETIQKAMISYICGHLCHWALDSHAHPYINYKTGSYSGMSVSFHHRFESMMDAMMLKKIRKENIKSFKFYLLARQSSYSVEAISRIYTPIMRDVYGKELSKKQIKDALDDWYHIQTYLYDPTCTKTKILQTFERKKNALWYFSGNVVPVQINPKYDVLNEEKKEWCYPTDNTKVSNESFMEIYDRAKNDILEIFAHFDDKEYVLFHLNNLSYDTGESELKKMIYFDIIYGEDGNYEDI
ncbi:MAG: zinc dependent phospholipase C family protein [Traorella sp.]